jgi:hypothetical protein
MSFVNFDQGTPVPETKPAKAIMAFLSFLGTYAGVAIADAADAAGWVDHVLLVVGGAVGTALVYWKKNYPKY